MEDVLNETRSDRRTQMEVAWGPGASNVDAPGQKQNKQKTRFLCCFNFVHDEFNTEFFFFFIKGQVRVAMFIIVHNHIYIHCYVIHVLLTAGLLIWRGHHVCTGAQRGQTAIYPIRFGTFILLFNVFAV